MANSPRYMAFLIDWLSPLGQIDTRPMFGGNGLYCGGLTFALVASDTLYLKVDDETRPRYEAEKLKAFQPFPDKPGVMQYYTPPPSFFEDRDVMADWGRAAIAAAARKSSGSRKKPAARKKRAK
jgi:DNA transformation protein